MIKKIYFTFCLLSLIGLVVACGVKGDPVPPATPAEFGRGKPVIKSPEQTQPLPKKRLPEYDLKNDADDDSN